jgi:hypothetical protein
MESKQVIFSLNNSSYAFFWLALSSIIQEDQPSLSERIVETYLQERLV